MRYFCVILTFLLATILPATSATADKAASEDAYASLSLLIGDWKREDAPDSKLTIRFQLTASGTTIMETWLYEGEPHSLTVYHRDHDTLLATHYCPQGNQPRMKLVADHNGDTIKFEFMDATNLLNQDQSHQHALSFKVTEGGALVVRGETYLSSAGSDVSEMKLVRVTP
ncbi:MAG: hypothetical protein AB3N28_05725 [Kordiimonas sp.]